MDLAEQFPPHFFQIHRSVNDNISHKITIYFNCKITSSIVQQLAISWPIVA